MPVFRETGTTFALPERRGAAAPEGTQSMVTSIVALARDARSWLRMLFVMTIMATAVALLSHHVFSPWQFDLQSAEEATRSKIPRVGIEP